MVQKFSSKFGCLTLEPKCWARGCGTQARRHTLCYNIVSDCGIAAGLDHNLRLPAILRKTII